MSRHAGESVRPRTLWAALLPAPVVGSTWFMVVYLVAEAACAPAIGALARRWCGLWPPARLRPRPSPCSPGRLRMGAASRAPPGPDTGRHAMSPFVGAVGLVLAGLFLFLVLLVAAPLVGSTVC